jgi:hypothetical protein
MTNLTGAPIELTGLDGAAPGRVWIRTDSDWAGA